MAGQERTRLGPEIFESAMARHCDMYRRRTLDLYVRFRAVFAESLVAELVGGEVHPDPSNAWDVTLNEGGRRIRIQVKCSGEHVPMNPAKPAAARWEFRNPTSGWDADNRVKLGPGRYWDVLVLARHEGKDLGAGWTFVVLSATTESTVLTAKLLAAENLAVVQPQDLREAVVAAALSSA